MTNQRASDGHALAERALAEIRELGLEASVTNFAVWSAHLQGTHPDLTRAINTMSGGPVRITDAAVQSLYFQHLLSSKEDMLDLGDVMTSHLSRATHALSEAGAHTSRYGEALDGASAALRAPAVEPHVLQTLVRTLIQATRNMRERTRELELRLSETSGEVRNLRNNLSKVREEALTDPLTGAANRKRFDEFLEEARQDALRRRAPLCLIMCDIDNFKAINDAWGHNVGDQVIRFIASALQQAARQGCLVARYGGEEFAIVARDMVLVEASEIAERARVSIESRVLRRRTTNEHLGHVTASFGVAQFEPDEPRWKLVERADSALYASKGSGRNKVTAQAA